MFRTTLFQISALMFIFSATAFGQDDALCKKFKISFSSPMKITIDGVFHGGNKIGSIIQSENSDKNIVDICIDTKHASDMEKNTVCYISENSIIVYNVWTSGQDLPENSTVQGFSNKISLFWYEIKLMFKSITE